MFILEVLWRSTCSRHHYRGEGTNILFFFIERWFCHNFGKDCLKIEEKKGGQIFFLVFLSLITFSLQNQQERWWNKIFGVYSFIFYCWLRKIDYSCGWSCFFNTSEHVTNRSQKYFTEIKVNFSFYNTSHTSQLFWYK